MKRLVFLALLVTFAACASAPPALSPPAKVAWQNTRVIKGLDIIRDTAIDANAQVPPLVSTDTTRKVVTWHQSALKVIDATGTGWKATVITSLGELETSLPAPDAKRLAPYFSLARTLISEVP